MLNIVVPSSLPKNSLRYRNGRCSRAFEAVQLNILLEGMYPMLGAVDTIWENDASSEGEGTDGRV